MKKLFFKFVILTLLICSFNSVWAQKPRSGTYTYKLAWAEWGGQTLGATCTVIIKGDSIRVINNGRADITGNKGDILDEGVIMTHKKTGKWIIGKNEKDKDAKVIGGCSEGPSEIDFKKRIFWSC